MKNKNTFRVLVIAAGILIAAGIVLSQVLFVAATPAPGKENTTQEQTDPGSGTAVQVAPTLSNHSVSVELNQSVEASVEKVLDDEAPRPLIKLVSDIILPYFQTLLRTLIAPNAP